MHSNGCARAVLALALIWMLCGVAVAGEVKAMQSQQAELDAWAVLCDALAASSKPRSVISIENCRPGSPPQEWDVNGAGDPTIQGFATQMSVDAGQQVQDRRPFHVSVAVEFTLLHVCVGAIQGGYQCYELPA